MSEYMCTHKDQIYGEGPSDWPNWILLYNYNCLNLINKIFLLEYIFREHYKALFKSHPISDQGCISAQEPLGPQADVQQPEGLYRMPNKIC